MKALLSGLLSLAVSIGAIDVMNLISQVKAKQQGVSLTELTKIVNGLYNKASTISSEQLDKLNNKIGSLSMPYNASSIIRNAYQQARNKLNDQVKNVNTSVNKINTNIGNVERSLNSLSSTSDSYRLSSAGKQEKADIEDQARKVYNDIDKLEQSLRS